MLELLSGSSTRALVLLPGAQMRPADIQRAGFGRAIEDTQVALDLFLPDLHINTADGSDASERLENVLEPLQTRYAELWLGGISLGGLLALHHAQRQPAGLAGLCLLAPYPGSRLTTNTIQRVRPAAGQRLSRKASHLRPLRVWLWL